MRPGSVERPTSARSIEGNVRQRLQNPNSHIYVVENDPNPSEIKSQNSSDNLNFKNFNQNIIEVSIRCIFLRVGDIDTLNERYYTEILVEASWETSALKDSANRTFDSSIHWTPKLEFMNGIGQVQDDITYTIRYNKQGLAVVTEHHRFKGTLWERMELQDFPMDIQALSVLITTSRKNSEMIFVKNLRKSSGVYRRVFTDEQEWDLFEHVNIEITEEIDDYFDNEHNHSIVICSCYAARKYGYFMWNAYFLIFLITSASFTTFPIPLANTQGRAQIACTLLLTSITFRSVYNKILPTISYLTALDVYAIGSIFSLCLLNIFHGVIGYVNYYVSTKTTNQQTSTKNIPNIIFIDRWALVVFTILFFSYQIGTIIWIYLVPLKKRRMMSKKDHKHQRHVASNFKDTKETFHDVVLRARKRFDQQNEISVVSNTDF